MTANLHKTSLQLPVFENNSGSTLIVPFPLNTNKFVCNFYCDTPAGEKNKFFSWSVRSAFAANKCVAKFILKGFRVRGAWYVIKNSSGKYEQSYPIKVREIKAMIVTYGAGALNRYCFTGKPAVAGTFR